MNLKKKLRHLANLTLFPRQYGKTTMMAAACKNLDGVYLCYNQEQARNIAREHGVVTKTIDVNLDGIRGPFFFDHYALEKLLKRAADKIESMEEKETWYDRLQMENDRLREENAKLSMIALDEEFK